MEAGGAKGGEVKDVHRRPERVAVMRQDWERAAKGEVGQSRSGGCDKQRRTRHVDCENGEEGDSKTKLQTIPHGEAAGRVAQENSRAEFEQRLKRLGRSV